MSRRDVERGNAIIGCGILGTGVGILAGLFVGFAAWGFGVDARTAIGIAAMMAATIPVFSMLAAIVGAE